MTGPDLTEEQRRFWLGLWIGFTIGYVLGGAVVWALA